jgi:zinc protease
VPFRHADSYALDVLSGLMTGQTGRLYKSLVLDKGIASGAFAGQNSMKYGGSFTFSADTKGDATPAELEAAWYAELARIIDEPIPVDELQKVKNQIAADAYRRLENPFFLAIQLLIYDGMGDWTYLNTWSERTLAVTAEDVKRVAQTYLTADNRAVAQYFRKEIEPGAEGEGGAMTGALPNPEGYDDLSPQQQQMVKQSMTRLAQMTDPDEIRVLLGQIEAQAEQVPPEMSNMMDVLRNGLEARIKQLEEGQ